MGIDKICDTLNRVISKAMRPKVPSVAPILLACSFAERPGLSLVRSYGNVVQELARMGFPTGDGVDGKPNMSLKYAFALLKEGIRMAREDARVEGSTTPGSIQFTGMGANAGGPLTATGYNTNCPKIGGIIT